MRQRLDQKKSAPIDNRSLYKIEHSKLILRASRPAAEATRQEHRPSYYGIFACVAQASLPSRGAVTGELFGYCWRGRRATSRTPGLFFFGRLRGRPRRRCEGVGGAGLYLFFAGNLFTVRRFVLMPGGLLLSPASVVAPVAPVAFPRSAGAFFDALPGEADPEQVSGCIEMTVEREGRCYRVTVNTLLTITFGGSICAAHV